LGALVTTELETVPILRGQLISFPGSAGWNSSRSVTQPPSSLRAEAMASF